MNTFSPAQTSAVQTAAHPPGRDAVSASPSSPPPATRRAANGLGYRVKSAPRFAAFLWALALALAAGCSRESAPSNSDPHAGHDHAHGQAEAGHEGHTHEPNPAPGAMCAEHGVPETQCGICQPQLISQLKPGDSLKVRVPAANSGTMSGVKVGPAETGNLSAGVECLAEITFDQNRVARIAAPVGGIIHSVETDLGARLKEKQMVAKIWSATIAEAVARAVLTHQTLERERKLRAERVTSERDLQQAEAEHRAACQQARTLGFTEEQIDRFGAAPDDPVMLEVRAPFAGEIVERLAVRGALVEAGSPLFMLADRSTMWAMLKIPESALAAVKPGQAVELQVESLPGRTFAGKLTWVSAQVDERTRMTTARAELANPDGALKANMFARARILTDAPRTSVVVPASAIHQVEGRPLVFVKVGDDLFEARAVVAGARAAGKQAILAGLKPGEPVVLAEGFPLKSQLLISRLGVGCAHE